MNQLIRIYLLLLLFFSCNKPTTQKLTIAAAANTRFAMEELVKTFTEETMIQCELIISASGTLTAQIMEGAPYDVFVAANMTYPEKLFEAKKTTGPPEVYAFGKLVLLTMHEILPETENLGSETIRHIAIANPKLAPYGTAAIEFLKYNNLYEKAADKLVFGESLSQTNQFIISKAADVGITSMSTVLSPEMAGKGKWRPIDPAAYSPITQGVVVINRKSSAAKKQEAAQFYQFLFSESGKTVLKQYGYGVGS